MNGRTKGRAALAKALRLAVVVLALAGALVLARSLVNRAALVNYDRGKYSAYPERLIHPLALGENYVVPYNLGNLAYQREEYARAARYYAEALRRNPPAEEKECAVRINLALALLHDYPFDELDTADRVQVDEALEVLLRARAVLTEDGCASEAADASDGHSEAAESLKRDIDEMIAKLTAPPPSPDSDGDGDDPQDDGGGEGEGDPSDDGDGNDDDQDGDGQDGDGQSDEGGAGDGESQVQRQQALRSQLDEQKQDLEEGTYGNAGASDFTYIDIGDMVGFGEGAPW